MMTEPSPLRTLHVYSGNLYGGIETFLRALAEEREKCAAMTPEFALCFEGRIAEELRATGARLHMLGAVRMSRPLSVVRARHKLSAVLRAHRPDVVVCHAAWPHAIFAPVVRRSGIRLIFYRHDIGEAMSWTNLLAGRQRPDATVANSHYSADHGNPTFRGVESRVVRYVIRSNAQRDAETRLALRNDLGAGKDDIVILQASRMQAWKGQALLVEALARLPQTLPWKCWLAGDAQRDSEKNYVASLHSAAERHGISRRIRFLGQRNDVPVLMGAADIFCQPNRAPEPFGIVFVEALDAGLPVVTTDVAGGALEILDGTCSLTSEATASGVADSLQQLLSNPNLRKRLANGARVKAAEAIDPPARLRELAEAISSRPRGKLTNEERE